MMEKSIIDIGWGDADIYVEGQLILHIGQVSDNDTINLFLYPEGKLVKSINEDSKCTHEILSQRKKN